MRATPVEGLIGWRAARAETAARGLSFAVSLLFGVRTGARSLLK